MSKWPSLYFCLFWPTVEWGKRPFNDSTDVGNATDTFDDSAATSNNGTDVSFGNEGSSLQPYVAFRIDVGNKLSLLTEIGSNISQTLDSLLDLSENEVYRQPNFSCPHWNRGDYQHVGPTGFYSTCYYVQPNV